MIRGARVKFRLPSYGQEGLTGVIVGLFQDRCVYVQGPPFGNNVSGIYAVNPKNVVILEAS